MFDVPAPLRYALLLSTASLIGCGGAATTMIPAKGKIAGMRQSLAGCTIQFSGIDAPRAIANARVGADGSFMLQTMQNHQKVDGVPAGRYQVVLNPGRDALTLPQTVTIAPGQADLLLELPLPK